MTARRHRRDFILDSGAISTLAQHAGIAQGYLDRVNRSFDGLVLIPVPVFTEVRSARRQSEVLLDRLLKALNVPAEGIAELTLTNASRAGVLRDLTVRRTGRDISAIDAQVVAIAEERSFANAVTIVTGDPGDITALVQATGRPNIAVDPI